MGLRYKLIILALAVVALLLVSNIPKQSRIIPKVPVTSLITGVVNLTVTWCGNGACDSWESYYDCPQDCSKPWVLFVDPTPRNEVITDNWVFVNITLNNTANLTYLEWEGINETMEGSGKHFYKNKTELTKDNYTFMVWANLTTGWNWSETRWVYVNYTAPPAPPPEEKKKKPEPVFNETITLPVEVIEPVEELKEENISFTNVTLTLKKAITYEPEIKTEIVKCEIYENITYVQEIPYQCLDVETNIKEEDIQNATIRFEMSKAWIVQENINVSSIKLIKQFDNRRQDLLTWKIGEDEELIYFEALTYSFSVFIILAEPLVLPPEVPKPYCGDGVCDISIGEGCKICPEDCKCAPGETCVRNTCIPECCLWGICGKFIICWYWWLAIILYAVSITITAVVATTFYRRRRKLQKLLRGKKKKKLKSKPPRRRKRVK